MKIQLLYLLIFICMFPYHSDKNIEKVLFHNSIENDSKIKPKENFSQNRKFMPDTSINELSLINSTSIFNSLGDLMPYLDKDKDIPFVFILSKDKKQYFKLSFFPGSNNNEFSYFEIGLLKDKLLKKKNILLSKYKIFITENNIKIGISKQAFLKNRNMHFLKTENNDLYTYEVNDFKNSAFLKAYNMSSYRAKYRFDNDTLVQFEFGFVYQ